jgi:hypothetical protein
MARKDALHGREADARELAAAVQAMEGLEELIRCRDARGASYQASVIPLAPSSLDRFGRSTAIRHR